MKANIRYYKNTIGTIKVLGQATHRKVNVNDLMGIEREELDNDDSTAHEKFKELCVYLNDY